MRDYWLDLAMWRDDCYAPESDGPARSRSALYANSNRSAVQQIRQSIGRVRSLAIRSLPDRVALNRWQPRPMLRSGQSELRPQPIGDSAGNMNRCLVGDREH